MNKKEFYEAPEWALRVLVLERTPLCQSPNNGGISDIEGDNVTDDGDGWSTGN